MRRLVAAAGVVALAMAAVSGTLATGGSAVGAPSTSAAVSITSGGACGQIFCFTPQTLTVAQGTTVVWTNTTSTSHTVTRCTPANCSGMGPGSGSGPSFNSGILGAGKTFSVTLAQPGTYVYYCQIHGYAVMHGTITVTKVLSVTTRSLPAGTVGQPYGATLAAKGGTVPFHWTVAQGALPAGLALSTTGSITGTPSAPGNSSFKVSVTDSSSPPLVTVKRLSITVS